MRELGDQDWELRRCTEPFFSPQEQFSRGIKAAELGSQPQELSCINPALTARLPSQSFSLSGFSYLIQMKGVVCIHLQHCLWSGAEG